MNKERQIDEMREIVNEQRHICHKIDCANCNYNETFGSDCIDERNLIALYAAGYRKQSDVVREFVAGVTVELNKQRDSELYDKDTILAIINKVAAEFGAEVEK